MPETYYKIVMKTEEVKNVRVNQEDEYDRLSNE